MGALKAKRDSFEQGLDTLVHRNQRIHTINAILVGDDELGPLTRRYVSLGLLFLAFIVGCMTFTRNGLFWNSEVSLRPDMMSGLYALLLVSPLYIRRIIPWSISVYVILSAILNVAVTAVLLQAILGAASFALLSLPMPFVISFAIAMTWLGIRPLVPLAWGVVIVFGSINLQMASDAMGLWGFVFVVCAAAGILLQFDFGVRQILAEAKFDFIGPTDETVQFNEKARRVPVTQAPHMAPGDK